MDYFESEAWWRKHNELAKLLTRLSESSDTTNRLINGMQSDMNKGFDRLDDGIYGLQSTLGEFINEYRGDNQLRAELERQRFEFMLVWDSMTIEERKEFLKAREKKAQDKAKMAKLRARKEEIRQSELTNFNNQFQLKWLAVESQRAVQEYSPERIAQRAERAAQHEANLARKRDRQIRRDSRVKEENQKLKKYLHSDAKYQMLSFFFITLTSPFALVAIHLSVFAFWWLVAGQNIVAFLNIFIFMIPSQIGIYFALRGARNRLAKSTKFRAELLTSRFIQAKIENRSK